MTTTYPSKTVLHRWSQKQSHGSDLVYRERKLAISKYRGRTNIEEQLFLQKFRPGFCCIMSLYRQFHLLHRQSPRHHLSSNMSIKPLWPNCIDTFIAPAGSSLWTEKCRLASPSVTNERREWPLSLSGTSPASTAALCISLCCVLSQPFGCERTKTISDLTEFHKSGPLAWVSWI